MAEGGPRHQPSSIERERRQSLDSQLLECPICLEQLRHPKSLPCLHLFCQECLGSYITKEFSGKTVSASFFSCPVCRKVTEPVNQSEAKETWAEQFPTNHFAVEMIKLSQKTSEPTACRPCAKKGKMNVPVKFWCEQYKTFFCAACKVDHHDMFHEECEPRDIADVNMSAKMRREVSPNDCGKHDEKIEYYCEDHQLLGCSKCIIVDHRKCEVVMSIEESRDKLRNSSKIDDLMDLLHKCTEAMETLIKDIGEQLQSISYDQDTALKSLTDLRQNIDRMFDTLQKELTDKLITHFKDEKANLELSRQQCERLMFAMQNTLTSSEEATMTDNTVGTICLFQRGRAEVASCKGLIQELEKSSVSTTLRHEYDTQTFDTNTDLTMGKIVVDKQQRNLPTTTLSVPLSERQLRIMGKFNIKLPSDKSDSFSCGIVYLHGGFIVLGDWANKNIKQFTENGDFLCNISMDGTPVDLCQVDDNTVAVMLREHTICIVSVEDLKLTLTSTIKLPMTTKRCYGITYRNNRFVVGTDTSLYSVSRKDGITSQLHTLKTMCLHLASDHHSGHVFASLHTKNPNESAVTRLSDGSSTDVMKPGILKHATGIDVDRENNVYVCGFDSHNVIQMSGDGTNVRELLTSSDGIQQPRAISVCADRVVITNGSLDQNTVHVFQLV
ncbi:uncharacterized protein LOC110462244 [Mizuhopecten yessoensis]|uniref:uncharacterized protein LOC110462244 n=1 Tax=Mizuhopecten yessoensis TaxID=6573 RepID=UPI000B45C9A9|nr:uncharacterized protein LOC110462244 [Mizuhopecten yessoensis]